MVRVKCRLCGEEQELNVTPEQLQAWTEGRVIQEVMSNLTPDERELLISQTCGTCFDALWTEEE